MDYGSRSSWPGFQSDHEPAARSPREAGHYSPLRGKPRNPRQPLHRCGIRSNGFRAILRGETVGLPASDTTGTNPLRDKQYNAADPMRPLYRESLAATYYYATWAA